MNKKIRYLELDVFRGVAVVMMVIFHFLYDVNMFHLAWIPLFTNPLWIVYRETLVFLFLGVSGACLFLDHGKYGDSPNSIHGPTFWKRTLKLAAGACVITVATYFYDKSLVILFGMLHFLALSAILCLPLTRAPRWALLVSFLAIAFGHMADLNNPPHYIPYIAWMGFGSLRMRSFEVMPLIPYIGYITLGIFIASHEWQAEKDYLVVRLNPLLKINHLFEKIGQHALMIYLLHRPISMAIVYFFKVCTFKAK